jgi:hypothetical protein
VITRGIRDYVARDWTAARVSKDTYWARRISRLGPAEAFRIAEDLRRQAMDRDREWPDPASRQQDLLSHVRLAERFRRAGAARRG